MRNIEDLGRKVRLSIQEEQLKKEGLPPGAEDDPQMVEDDPSKKDIGSQCELSAEIYTGNGSPEKADVRIQCRLVSGTYSYQPHQLSSENSYLKIQAGDAAAGERDKAHLAAAEAELASCKQTLERVRGLCVTALTPIKPEPIDDDQFDMPTKKVRFDL